MRTHTTKEPCHQLGDMMLLEPLAVPLLNSFTPLSHSFAAISIVKWVGYLRCMKILSRGMEHHLKQWGGKEINVYHVEIKGVMCKFAVCIKHFKVTTEADNIFEEEQMPQIAEIISPTPAASEPPFNSNQVDPEATTSNHSKCHSTLMTSPNFVHMDLKWMTTMNQFLKILGHLQH